MQYTLDVMPLLSQIAQNLTWMDFKALIIKTKSKQQNKDGSIIFFDNNSVSLINKQGKPLSKLDAKTSANAKCYMLADLL